MKTLETLQKNLFPKIAKQPEEGTIKNKNLDLKIAPTDFENIHQE